ncbi:carbon-nitrogen hydrolase family protein [Thaumasiovibrio subtropicus]|uniref:carbon-nitrogen hydrolase family protein n=1 Tax=Thaumasiovibrio subtropicus TaxID=1891207 RepID=UPI000B35D360|nr:carbon-nitrogen hydrolase family protein [Thaumasiovibrio subtropicus]
MENQTLTVALAQFEPSKGDVNANLKHHAHWCDVAADKNADIIVFPELSVTGYEPSLAGSLAIDSASSEIEALSALSKQHQLVVIAGAPIRPLQSKPFIGAVICYPCGKVDIYKKQYLHPGEEVYFSQGDENYFLTLKGLKIALAVCADFTSAQHHLDAKAQQVDLYLISALITHSGYAADSEIFSSIARQLDAPVLLSNFVGVSGGMDCAGQSAVWDAKGQRGRCGSSDKAELMLFSTLL